MDGTEHYYYDGQKQIEMRRLVSEQEQVMCQYVWGTQYIDEIVRADINGDPGTDNDCLEAGTDASYYYHQDANYNVTAVTDINGDVVQRISYSAYGRPSFTDGDGVPRAGASFGPAGNQLHTAALAWQGLFNDLETGHSYNRARTLHHRLGRFMQKDPLGYFAGMGLFEYVRSRPDSDRDPFGLAPPEGQFPGPAVDPPQMTDEELEYLRSRGDCMRYNSTRDCSPFRHKWDEIIGKRCPNPAPPHWWDPIYRFPQNVRPSTPDGPPGEFARPPLLGILLYPGPGGFRGISVIRLQTITGGGPPVEFEMNGRKLWVQPRTTITARINIGQCHSTNGNDYPIIALVELNFNPPLWVQLIGAGEHLGGLFGDYYSAVSIVFAADCDSECNCSLVPVYYITPSGLRVEIPRQGPSTNK